MGGVDLYHLGSDDMVVEAVVSPRSSLVGKRARDADFRSKFNGAIVSIHRHGTRLTGGAQNGPAHDADTPFQ